MGIRPHLIFLVGVDDLQTDPKEHYKIVDPRWTGPLVPDIFRHMEDDIPVPQPREKDDYTEKAWRDMGFYLAFRKKQFYEVLDWNPEYGLPNVMGYKLDSLYDNDILWALAAFEAEEHGGCPTWVKHLPSYPIEKDISNAAQLLKGVRRYREEGEPIPDFYKENARQMRDKIRCERWGWNIVSFGHMAASYADSAMYLLRKFGLTGVRSKDIKFMLYMYWS